MSPEEEETSTAVAESPAVPPSPPESPEPVPEAQEPESDAAAVEGEAPEPESGTPTDEGLSVDDQIVDAISQLAKDNPDAFDKAITETDELREKYQGPEGERAKLEAEKAQTTRIGAVNAAAATYQPFSQVVNTAEWQRWGDDLTRQAKEAVKKAIEDGNADVDILPEGFGDQLAGLAQYGNDVRTSQQGYLGALYQNALHTRLENSKAHRFLSVEERESVKSMPGIEAIDLYIEVALKAAPKAVKEALKEENAKTRESVDLLERIQSIGGGNGRKATKAAGQPGSQPQNEQEARNWHATGKWDNKQMRAYLRKQQE